MDEYKLSGKQVEALKYIGGSYEIIRQYDSGVILISIGKDRFTISPSGEVEEIMAKGDKKEKKIPDKFGRYKLTEQQKKLMWEHGNPPIVRVLSNGDLVVKHKGEEWIFGYDGICMTRKEFEKKYAVGKAPPSKPKPYVYISKTVCQQKPETCKPREIEHVAWDADHTIWNLKSGIASSVTGPLQKIDDDTVIELGKPYKYIETKKGKKGETKGYEYKDFWTTLAEEEEGWWKEPESQKELEEIEDSLLEGLTEEDKEYLSSLEGPATEEKPLALPEGKKPEPEKEGELKEINRITLLPTFRETLDRLEKQGIKSSVISLNTKGTVSRILEAFGLADRFVEIRDSWDNKGKVFSEITHNHNLCPCSSIFVDDTVTNVRDVAEKCGMGLVIGKEKDVEKPIDIFKFIKES